MRACECKFEAEVLAAVVEGRWPARTEAALAAHVPGCRICTDIVAIACAVESAREEMPAPAIPDSGRVWWLAQRRARLEAAEMANRPIRAAQSIAFVCALVLLGVYFGAAAMRFHAALALVTKELSAHSGLALAMTAVVLLLPAAAYLAIGRE